MSDRDAPPGKVFNGHMFDIALYSRVFADFELEGMVSKSMEHIERYKSIAPKEDVFGENL